MKYKEEVDVQHARSLSMALFTVVIAALLANYTLRTTDIEYAKKALELAAVFFVCMLITLAAYWLISNKLRDRLE